ncbi:MAG: undecaprenyl/decaprenyl-phosphate alpha-N-acetylglucosaminyl 1-phosphate transferase [Methylococcaceae bacterium]|nr:undecaprenyl/decaprenyl-phosphate alpha-N-acetylglucosaminyl 1-phosphate transferase [Methylococcaceae bacterium]
MLYYSVFLTALFISMVLVAAMMRLAPQLGLVDLPGHRKVHAEAIPRVGGIGIACGSVLAALLWLDLDRDLLLVLGGMITIALFALLDDRLDLNYKIKFAGQLAAALLVVMPGSVLIDHLSLQDQLSLPRYVSVPLTVLFLIGMTNAINLSDGLDGLAAGLSILSLSCLIILAAITGSAMSFILMALTIIGATLGFLRYNTHPAMVFMGDTGSQFLGFSLGVLAIWLSQKVNTAIAPELPLVVMGLPIIDTLLVMSRRIIRGCSPFLPDRTHFHHRLLELGLDHYQVVVAIYAIQAGFVAAAYFLRYESTLTILSLYAMGLILIAGIHPFAQRLGWQLGATKEGNLSAFSSTILRTRAPIAGLIYVLITAMIGAYQLGAVAVSAQLAGEILPLCLAICLFAVACRVFRLSMATAFIRLTIYSCALLSSYVGIFEPTMVKSLDEMWHHAYFATLMLLIAIGMRISADSSFRLTPSDFLMMAALVTAANLPLLKDPRYSQITMEAAVILYGIEFVLNRNGVGKDILLGIAVLSVLAIGAKAI